MKYKSCFLVIALLAIFARAQAVNEPTISLQQDEIAEIMAAKETYAYFGEAICSLQHDLPALMQLARASGHDAKHLRALEELVARGYTTAPAYVVKAAVEEAAACIAACKANISAQEMQRIADALEAYDHALQTGAADLVIADPAYAQGSGGQVESDAVHPELVEGQTRGTKKFDNLIVRNQASVGNLFVGGDTIINHNLTVNNDLRVRGNEIIDGNLTVRGATTFTSTSILMPGSQTITGDLKVGGNIKLPNVNAAGTQGILQLGVDPIYLYNAGTSNFYAGDYTAGIATVTTGSQNIAIGTRANPTLTTQNNTIAIGTNSSATASGAMALGRGTTAPSSGSVSIGDGAAASGENAIAIGIDTLASGDSSVAMGDFANASGVSGGVAVGRSASTVGDAVAVGALANAAGDSIAVGASATTEFQSSIAIGSGASTSADSLCIAIGPSANVQTRGLAIGTAASSSGFNSVVIGTLASAASGGDLSVAIGNQASITAAASQGIAIGSTASATGAFAIAIGSGVTAGLNQTAIRNIFGGTVGVTNAPVLVDDSGVLGTIASSKKFKENFRSLDKHSAQIYKLNPVKFDYKAEKGGAKDQFGLIAEEVAQHIPEIVVHDAQGEVYTVQYHVLPTLLLNEMKHLAARVAQLEAAAKTARK